MEHAGLLLLDGLLAVPPDGQSVDMEQFEVEAFLGPDFRGEIFRPLLGPSLGEEARIHRP